MEVVVYLFNLYLLLLPLPSYVYLRDVYLRDVYLRECPIISALLFMMPVFINLGSIFGGQSINEVQNSGASSRTAKLKP